MFSSFKKQLIVLFAAIGVILIAIFSRGLYLPTANQEEAAPEENLVQSDRPQLVSSDPVDTSTIGPTQKIELNFNMPLENEGELKIVIDPKFEYTLKLSEDKKTATLTPNDPLPAGAGYTLFVKGNTQFAGKKLLENDAIVHFKTVNHSGI